MPFFQAPPALGNQYAADRVLRSYLARAVTPDMLAAVEPAFSTMGELSGGRLYQMKLAERLKEPTLTQWDAWGHRVDHIEVTPLWKEAARIACEQGVVAAAYERAYGALSRVQQFVLAYLFEASTDVYTCPLAMTDGAAKTMSVLEPSALTENAIRRLTSRDPAFAWTSGQWMTERTGGSDVGLSETVAKPVDDGSGRFRLYGTKWFTSATTSQMALTLARPKGNPAGSRGLALFYVETYDEAGERNHMLVNRLKDKLGTRKVPTAELSLEGTIATPLAGLKDGVRHIAPMLNITRVWNAIGAIGGMRRGIALARDYAKKRVQFGAPLADKPLHTDTLAGLQAEFEGAFHLTFRVVELLGREEAGELDEAGTRLLRLLTPIMKLTTGKQSVGVLSEVLECFGGAGYVEDTGLPVMLRDAQVLPIWEGTTNVLSLDTLRAIGKDRSLDLLAAEVERLAGGVTHPQLAKAGRMAVEAVAHAKAWLERSFAEDGLAVEAGARRFALTLGRALELSLLVRHAQWSIEHERDGRALFAAERFAAHGVDLIREEDRQHAAALANDVPAAVEDVTSGPQMERAPHATPR